VLSSLLKSILSKSSLSVGQSGVDLLKLVSGVVDLLVEHLVLLLELFVLVSLLWIQVIESSLVLEVDLLDLALVRLNLSLSVSFFREQVVEVRPLFVVLVLDMHVEGLNIFRLGVTSVLVQR